MLSRNSQAKSIESFRTWQKHDCQKIMIRIVMLERLAERMKLNVESRGLTTVPVRLLVSRT